MSRSFKWIIFFCGFLWILPFSVYHMLKPASLPLCVARNPLSVPIEDSSLQWIEDRNTSKPKKTLLMQGNDTRKETLQSTNVTIFVNKTVTATKLYFNQTFYCNQDTFLKVEGLRKLWGAWTKFAQAFGIEYWINFGSLLGKIRLGGIIPYDEDIDVMIPNNVTSTLESLSKWFSKTNNNSEYYLLVHPHWKLRPSQRNFSSPCNFKAPNARWQSRNLPLWVDIWSALPSLNNSANVIFLDKYRKWNETDIPKSWVYPLKNCVFEKIETFCPNEEFKIINKFYNLNATQLNNVVKVCRAGNWTRGIVPREGIPRWY